MTHLTLPNGERFTVDGPRFIAADGRVILNIKQYWELVKPSNIR